MLWSPLATPIFFYTLTLPFTLVVGRGTRLHRKDKVLFLDARHTYRQIDPPIAIVTSEQY